MKFCVVGPMHPLRGGIAQHATLLCRHLAEAHDVKAVTFNRLYPSMLFPGRTQTDQSKQALSFDAVPIIDSINPVTWFRARSYIRRQQPDCVIVEWWHPFFAPCIGTILSGVRDARRVLICHNVLPHEGEFMVKQVIRWALRHGDGFIVHAAEEGKALTELLPGCRVKQTILPDADVFPRRGISREDARSELGIKGRTILFFGLVRKYKGLIDLIHAMDFLKDMGLTLLVVGEFYDNKDGYLAEIQRLGLQSSVHIVDSFVSNEDVESYFAAADLLVMPYRSATQSGVVQVAYRFERPIVATSVGGLPEVVDDGRTGLIVPPENPKELARAIRTYYDQALETRFTQAIRADEGRFSWDRVIDSLESLGASL